MRVVFVDRLFPRDPGGRVSGSRPNAPATLREVGMDRSGYRAPSSFCAMDRLPALCEVWRSRRSSSGCSPTRPAASSGGGELVSIGGCSCSPRVSALTGRRLLMPTGPGRRRFDADPRDGFGVFGDSFWPGRPFFVATETRDRPLLHLMHDVFALPFAASDFVVIGVHVDVLAHTASVPCAALNRPVT